ncbi:Uncharacterised protein g3177 [Pycnogonum litorale]
MGSGGSKKKEQIVKQNGTKVTQKPVVEQSQRKRSKANDNPESVTVSEETLRDFLEYEKEIKAMQNRKILADYQVKVLQREHLEMDIIKAEAEYKELEARTMKEAMDVEKLKDLKQTFMDQGTYEKRMSKETEEHIDAMNKQEIQKKEIENMLNQKKKLDEDIDQLSKDGDKLQDMVVKQEKILHEVFDGEYGSELENQLEKECVMIEEQKNYIDAAFYKWKKAQTMVLQAVRQFSSALNDWKQVKEVPSEEMETKYSLGTKARNSLISALQNMQGAQRFLTNITFPYCDKTELDTLNEAITYIFTDMQTSERHEHAFHCYDTTYRRAAALHQWMTQVINQAIVRDLASVTEAAKQKSSELKQERVSLIIKMIKERGGTVDYDNVSVADEELATPETDLFFGDSATPDSSAAMPTPIATAELPPIPSRDDIMGQIQDLKKQHDENRANFISAQDKNLNAVKVRLQERLNQRRTRRSNSIMNAREVQLLKAK